MIRINLDFSRGLLIRVSLMDKYLLEIKDLETSIKIENKWYPTIDQISLNLEKMKY